MEDEYVCQCDACTGNIDNCAVCMKTFGARELTDGLCDECRNKDPDPTGPCRMTVCDQNHQCDICEFNLTKPTKGDK